MCRQNDSHMIALLHRLVKCVDAKTETLFTTVILGLFLSPLCAQTPYYLTVESAPAVGEGGTCLLYTSPSPRYLH